ncbi:hypothetical protein BU26DRAFT_36449 [Trematosphaeria pertusa]|uniref:RING-type domain-containing protein n=1 Tax=Trematosphaeria pertusa TaxID=390896 RepID=A0A6A6J4H4_9PLEO|nr:uncharacterized protein BU26DRAFT_36449 [Trematosphaeria pertusa]KAF2257122.1 hypothetical protein BU26DRAFT_36449 [Trematosphaeria pertusa]
MAESNFSSPLHSQFSIAPSPPSLRPQDPEPPVPWPNYASYGSFSPYDAPAYNFYPGLSRSPLPDPYGAPMSYPPQDRYHQFPAHGGFRAGGYNPPPAGMFQHGPNGPAAPGLAASHHHGVHMPGSPHPEVVGTRGNSDFWPMMDSSMYARSQGYSPPSYPHHVSPQLHGADQHFGRRPPSLVPGVIHAASSRASSDRVRPGEGRGPMRGAIPSTSEQARHMTSPGRRASYERQSQNNQPGGTSERRPSLFISAQARRPDRSVSPRTSNRRSFDRYSTDLSESSNSHETDETTRARMHRARRPRIIPSGELRARLYATSDHPNVPTPQQMKALKEKLRHLLPDQLPEGASTACDICQKDYSAKYISPSEQEEMAIQLPCKHVFGEHCINTWFDTCKTHKNKVTCPMCRKLLIEPQSLRHSGLFGARSEMAVLYAHMSHGDRQLLETIYNGDRELLANSASRDLEGDFAHT